jgi:uncharacterized protein (TIGR02996 family)
MTNDRDALFRAILDNPAEETPRLVYADWLEEFGKPWDVARAEFIRVQCAIARGPCLTPVARELYHHDLYGNMPIDFVYEACGKCEMCRGKFAALHERSAALLKKHVASWLPKPLRPGYPALRVEGNIVWHDAMHGYVVFERGFIARAGCELPWQPEQVIGATMRFADKLRAIFASNPLTDFTVSFEDTSINLHGEIRQKPDAPRWELGWDSDTCKRNIPEVISGPPVLQSPVRKGIGVHLPGWFHIAIEQPARVARAVAENDLPDDVDPLDTDLEFDDDGDQGYGHTHW